VTTVAAALQLDFRSGILDFAKIIGWQLHVSYGDVLPQRVQLSLPGRVRSRSGWAQTLSEEWT